MQKLPQYVSVLGAALGGLLSTFPIDFAGPLRRSQGGYLYILVSVEHKDGCTIAMNTRDTTASTVIMFVQEGIIRSFGPPKEIMSEKGTFFTANSLALFMKSNGIKMAPVMVYASMSNGRTVGMVRTLKSVTGKVVRDGVDWAEAIHKSVFGYHHRHVPSGVAPIELLYEVNSHMIGTYRTKYPIALGTDR